MECLFVGVCINQILFHMYTCYNILWYNNSKKVEDNMIEKILAYILACCNNSEFEQTTVALISENLKISRSQVSVVLNKLVKENKLIRIESNRFVSFRLSI